MKSKKRTPTDAAELRSRAERRLQKRKTENAQPSTEHDALRLVHELQVHQIELEMQNEELVAARKELEAGLKRYTDLYDFAPVGYFTLDRNGAILQANLAGASLLGLERAKLERRRFGTFVAEDDRVAFTAFLSRAFAGESHEVYEAALQREQASGALPEGSGQKSPRYVHIEAAVCEDGQTCRAVLVDITERKWAEEERKRMSAKLQEAHRMEGLGMLAGGIAHDLNNLLTPILGHAQLAMHELPPSSLAYQNVQKVETASRRAAELVEQILAYSGKGQFVVEPVCLSDLVMGTARLLGAAIPKKCALKYDLVQDLPAVKADATQMRQVAMNLIINASEAIGERLGVITVNTGVMECKRAFLDGCALGEGLAPGPYVYLEVQDTGCGIPPEALPRVFEPFFSTKALGRGLGLAAVAGIVRAHHGAIHVQSKANQGSTVRVVCPPPRLASSP